MPEESVSFYRVHWLPIDIQPWGFQRFMAPVHQSETIFGWTEMPFMFWSAGKSGGYFVALKKYV